MTDLMQGGGDASASLAQRITEPSHTTPNPSSEEEGSYGLPLVAGLLTDLASLTTDTVSADARARLIASLLS